MSLDEMLDYHCMVCDLVLVQGVWINKIDYWESMPAGYRGQMTTGVYHCPCAKKYVKSLGFDKKESDEMLQEFEADIIARFGDDK